jgi:hypothetical protein
MWLQSTRISSSQVTSNHVLCQVNDVTLRVKHSQTAWLLKVWPTRFAETSVTHYQPTPSNILKPRRPQLHRSQSWSLAFYPVQAMKAYRRRTGGWCSPRADLDVSEKRGNQFSMPFSNPRWSSSCPSHCCLLCQGMTDFFWTRSRIISWRSVEESFPGWSTAPSNTADEVAIMQWLHMNAQKWLWCRLWLCGLWFRVVPPVKFATEVQSGDAIAVERGCTRAQKPIETKGGNYLKSSVITNYF